MIRVTIVYQDILTDENKVFISHQQKNSYTVNFTEAIDNAINGCDSEELEIKDGTITSIHAEYMKG